MHRSDIEVIGQLMAEGGATEEVGCSEVNRRVVEDIEALVAHEVVVFSHGIGKDGVVTAHHSGKAYGVALVDTGEPLAHAYLGVVAQRTADHDDVALCVGGHLLVVGAGGRGLTCEQHVGTIPKAEGGGVDGVALGHAVDIEDVPPGDRTGVGVDERIHQVVMDDVDGGVAVRLRQFDRAAVDIDGAAAGGFLHRHRVAGQVVKAGHRVAEVVLHLDVA